MVGSRQQANCLYHKPRISNCRLHQTTLSGFSPVAVHTDARSGQLTHTNVRQNSLERCIKLISSLCYRQDKLDTSLQAVLPDVGVSELFDPCTSVQQSVLNMICCTVAQACGHLTLWCVSNREMGHWSVPALGSTAANLSHNDHYMSICCLLSCAHESTHCESLIKIGESQQVMCNANQLCLSLSVGHISFTGQS